MSALTSTGLLACALGCAAYAAEPSSTVPESLLDTGYRQMYDLQFDQAHKTFAELQRLRPNDPMGPVSDAAAYLFSELDRLHALQSEFFVDDDKFKSRKRPPPDPAVRKAFDLELAKAAALSNGILAKSGVDKGALFSTTMQLGLQSNYDALVEKRYLASLKETKNGRLAAEKLLAVDPGFYDAYLAIGVENYVLSLKPAPLRWLLQMGGAETDKQLGLEKLRLTAEKGHYLRPFARLLLAVAALRDKNAPQAKAILGDLVREFPNNHLYREELDRLR
jgi:hypothetical protein